MPPISYLSALLLKNVSKNKNDKQIKVGKNPNRILLTKKVNFGQNMTIISKLK